MFHNRVGRTLIVTMCTAAAVRQAKYRAPQTARPARAPRNAYEKKRSGVRADGAITAVSIPGPGSL